ETATEAVEGTGDALTVDGFDLDRVKTMIDEADIGALQKSALQTALDAAKDSPDALNSVLEQVRTALGN
ncbi:MAG: translation initiation factor 3, partial [Alphaproteobacteria bacterium]|nr:translation initiation factor 3 [Alphaproteobacteria bacterium]